MASGDEAVGTALQAFGESAEVSELLDELSLVVCDLRRKETAEQRFAGETMKGVQLTAPRINLLQ